MSAQASAAVTPDVALKGDVSYFRVGLFSRNFNKNAGDVGRLGNENDTFLELAPSLTLAELDGVEYRLISSFAMSSEYKGGWAGTNNQRGDRASRNMENAGKSDNSDLKDFSNLSFGLTQAYVRVTGLLDSDKDAAIWVGKRYQRQDSHVVDAFWRDVSGDSVGIENLSVGSGKFRATWVRRDGEAVFTNKYDGYTALGWDDTNKVDLRPSKITNNIFDVSYAFPVGAESFLDLGYTFIAPQRYASEYSNYGYKMKDEVGNSHLVLARLDTKLFDCVNHTSALRYVRGSTAEGGFGAHTYGVHSQDDSSYNIDFINIGSVNFTDRIGMMYHTWFNFARTTNNIGENDSRTVSRSFQLVLRPHYKLTKMTRLVLEAGMSTKSTATDDYLAKEVKDRNSFSNSQAQKLTLAYAITPDAGNAFSRPEIRFFVTYKHYNDSHVGTYGNGFKVENVATRKPVQLYEGRKTETFFGAQVEAWF
ncbi:carbohydrate porin [Succinivibrio faecicola]|uniref:Carbohydrate porin n=1 Tax=Succinivibrio faecicola TaxID=2820300 RepID=A0ABS7DID6_9GAMM|nr:carbohydrate porin [Succinivibrio faecicola]MBW7570301.1 carbohydrate porin [Succinivibrio faecicola]